MSLHDPMFRLLRFLLLSSGLLLGVLLASGQAQVTTTITPDGTLGTAVTQSGTVHDITGGTRPGNGPNLFHSFGRFSVGTNDTARFSGPTGIVNILNRVTGGQQSVIDGRLQSTIPGANVYLLNPSGVLFGPNATLDISGSFHVSTADVLRFADGAAFSAHIGERSTLTTAPPAAFGFLGPTPTSITVQGSSLGVSEGKAVSVVGGDIQIIGGQLVAPGGRVQIASVASPGEVLASPVEMEPNLQVNAFTRLGQLTLSQHAFLNVSGTSGGTVLIRSGRLLVDQSSIRADTLGNVNGARKGIDIAVAEDIRHTQGAITAASRGAGDAGDVTVTARSLHADGALIGAATFGDGRAGAVTVEVGTLTLANGAQIDSSSFGPGHGGTVRVTATETLTLTGTTSGGSIPSGVFANAQGVREPAGDAGTVVVTARNVTVAEGAEISSSSFGARRGGTVTVTATDSLTITGQDSFGNASGLFANALGSGDAGHVAVVTPALAMDGGKIQAVSFNSGNAGSITLEVGQLTLTGGAQIGSNSLGTGHGGTITVTATAAVSLAENAQIDASGAGGGTVLIRGGALLVDQASISADTVGNVDGSGIGIDLAIAEAIRLTPGGAISTTSSGAGQAGDVRITADSVHMAGATIGAEAFGAGRAGDIVMHVGTLTLTPGAKIDSTTTGTGQGGDIVVTATQGMTIAGAHNMDNPLDLAGLFAGTFGRGNAGRVAIATPTFTLEGFASISPSTFNAGNAGSVEITADRVVLSEGGSIFSNTQGSGQGGTVTITARESLSLRNGARLSISAFDRGNAGRVSIATPNLIMQGGFIETKAEGTGGNAGTIVVDADRMTLTAGAAIDSSTQGAGRGGSVSIRGGSLIMDGAFINALTKGDMAGGSIDIRLTDALDMRNAGAILAATFGAGRGGDIAVEVGNLTLTGGAEINGTTSGPGPGGNLNITAHNSLSILGRSSAPFLSLSGLVTNALEDGTAGRIVVTTPTLQMDDGVIQAITLGKGSAGDIQLNVGSLTLTAGAQISSSSGATLLETEALTSATGPGGNVAITATDFVTISGRAGTFPSGVSTETSGSGNAGHIALSTPILTMQDGRISSATTGDGRAGDLMLHVGRLTLAGGAQIASASGDNAGAVGSGRGGEVTVIADEAITISGAGSTISSDTFGSGDAGNISLTTATLRMDNAGTIEAGGAGGRAGDIRIGAANITLTGGASINTSATGAGPGGNVIVTAADLLSLSGHDANGVGSGLASGTLGSGVGGNIVLQAQRLELTDGGRISVLSLGAGNAGNIVLQAGQTFQSRHGAVTAAAEQADGGNIELTVGSRVELRDSQMTATVKAGVGKGGNITIDPEFVVLQGSQVRADAFGGPGGNVRIAAGVFLADPASQVSASSALGINGVVNIQAPVTSISGAVAPLPQEFAPIAELLRDRCAERRREGRVSRLVLGGRDGIPSEPGSLLLSPLIQTDPRENEEQARTSARTGRVQERAWHVQAGALTGLDAECARWIGH